jgi:hypothetical protein
MVKSPLPILLVATAAVAAPAIAPPAKLALPDGAGGVGFDDLMWSPALHRVLVPAGRTGMLDLVDPASKKIDSIAGFSTTKDFGGGHGQGSTSADAGAGLVFASDRGRGEVAIVDPNAKKIVGTVKLAAGPDYVRWIEPLKEVWVTEPKTKSIEYFALDKGKLVKKGAFEIAGGPESLVVDAARGRAYTHTWKDETVAIDLKKHAEVARWKNGCAESRGIALDEARGLLFVGCDEGKATALDVAHDGKRVGSVDSGKGVDIIAYSAKLGHLYIPGGDAKTLTIAGVSANGALTALGSVATAEDATCVAADDAAHVYVCDPKQGGLLVVSDPFPASR